MGTTPLGTHSPKPHRQTGPLGVASRPGTSGEAHAVLALQRTIGNRAVAHLLSSALEVTPADHPFEDQAQAAERVTSILPSSRRGSAGVVQRRPSPLATGGGFALDPVLRRRLEPSVGSLSGVRVHSGDDADALTATLGAEALTHGSDIFVSPRHYRRQSDDGDRLLAHEAAHATGAAAASGMVHLKRTKKHLDFLRIKKNDTHLAREAAYQAFKALGNRKLAEKIAGDTDTYGHWWLEAGTLADPDDLNSWNATESYGWWPDPNANLGLKETLKITAVNGVLNRGEGEDPHHGDRAETEYHPVLEVDDAAGYSEVRNQVMGQVHDFAGSFKGSWNWRLAWGKNCHTFVDRLKKKVGLHHQKAKGWVLAKGASPPGAKGYNDDGGPGMAKPPHLYDDDADLGTGGPAHIYNDGAGPGMGGPGHVYDDDAGPGTGGPGHVYDDDAGPGTGGPAHVYDDDAGPATGGQAHIYNDSAGPGTGGPGHVYDNDAEFQAGNPGAGVSPGLEAAAVPVPGGSVGSKYAKQVIRGGEYKDEFKQGSHHLANIVKSLEKNVGDGVYPSVADGMKQRFGWSQEDCDKYLSKIKNIGTTNPDKPLVTALRTDDERKSYELHGGGSVTQGVAKEPYDTSKLFSKFKGAGWAIYVMDATGRLFAAQHKVGLFHHSSFFAGGNVSGAGEIKTVGGVVEGITNKSGHYTPTAGEMVQVFAELQSRGVDLSSVTYYHIGPSKSSPSGSPPWTGTAKKFYADN